MLKIMKRSIRRALRQRGYDIVSVRPTGQDLPNAEFPPDFDEADIALYRYVEPFTLTSKERIFALRKSVEYIIEHNIPGDVVECGVWKGGSMMAVARTLTEKGANSRKLYLFDTFEGMSEPTESDQSFRGDAATDLYEEIEGWCHSPLDEVKRNMRDTGYDEKQVVFVEGKVEATLPTHAPDQISLLRLDTDWFESTYHELMHLYPRLSVGGVLIIDDYGHWTGAKKAVDQYIDELNLKILLHRIDYTGRICVKLEP